LRFGDASLPELCHKPLFPVSIGRGIELTGYVGELLMSTVYEKVGDDSTRGTIIAGDRADRPAFHVAIEQHDPSAASGVVQEGLRGESHRRNDQCVDLVLKRSGKEIVSLLIGRSRKDQNLSAPGLQFLEKLFQNVRLKWDGDIGCHDSDNVCSLSDETPGDRVRRVS
jgi:hypothetical protein